MSKPLNLTSASTTITSIKSFIYEEKGRVSKAMQWALIEHAAAAYEIKGVHKPRMSAISFVSATIRHAQRR